MFTRNGNTVSSKGYQAHVRLAQPGAQHAQQHDTANALALPQVLPQRGVDGVNVIGHHAPEGLQLGHAPRVAARGSGAEAGVSRVEVRLDVRTRRVRQRSRLRGNRSGTNE